MIQIIIALRDNSLTHEVKILAMPIFQIDESALFREGEKSVS